MILASWGLLGRLLGGFLGRLGGLLCRLEALLGVLERSWSTAVSLGGTPLRARGTVADLVRLRKLFEAAPKIVRKIQGCPSLQIACTEIHYVTGGCRNADGLVAGELAKDLRYTHVTGLGDWNDVLTYTPIGTGSRHGVRRSTRNCPVAAGVPPGSRADLPESWYALAFGYCRSMSCPPRICGLIVPSVRGAISVSCGRSGVSADPGTYRAVVWQRFHAIF